MGYGIVGYGRGHGIWDMGSWDMDVDMGVRGHGHGDTDMGSWGHGTLGDMGIWGHGGLRDAGVPGMQGAGMEDADAPESWGCGGTG